MTSSDNKFYELLDTLPEPGDILISLDLDGAEFTRDGEKIYTRAVVDDDATGWYLRDDKKGLMVMIQPSDHNLAVGRAKKVEIVRVSNSRNCLIARIVETI